jgi:hypothetical protein
MKQKTKEEIELERLASEKKAEDELAANAQKVVEGEPVKQPASASSPDIIKRDQHDRMISKQ